MNPFDYDCWIRELRMERVATIEKKGTAPVCARDTIGIHTPRLLLEVAERLRACPECIDFDS